MNPRAKEFGFTLTELIVVTAIVGLLFGLLLPAVQRSRAAARRTVCQSNLRQWAFAVIRYADGHGGDIPRRGQGVQPTTQLHRDEDWFNALPPYAESQPLVALIEADSQFQPSGVWLCPELIGIADGRYFSYGMNMWLSPWQGSRPDNFNSVGSLSTMAFLADGPGDYCAVLPSTKPYSPSARHAGVVQIAFLDGRVAAYEGAAVGTEIGLTERERVRWRPEHSAWEGPGG